MKKHLTILALFFPIFLMAQWDEVEIKETKVSDNVYMLAGKGGNIAVLINSKGAVMIDAQFSQLSEKIKSKIEALTDQPIKYLINTHWHHDHTHGNQTFGKDVIILAHENVYERLSNKQLNTLGRESEPLPAHARPQITFPGDFSIKLDGEDILVFHPQNAHTDGDAMVYFPGQNVIHMGDTYFNGLYPFIDVKTGGSLNGMIDAVNKALFLANDDTVIIPGHGPVSNKAELTIYRDMLATINRRVEKAVAKGKSREDIINAKFTSEFDDPWGKIWLKPDEFMGHILLDKMGEE